MRTHVIVTSFILLLVLSVPGTASDRPADKGTFYFNGTAAVNHSSGDLYSRDGTTIVGIGIAPGYFVADHFAMGLTASVYTNSDRESTNNWAVGPWFGFYFDPASSLEKVGGSVLPFFRLFGKFGDVNNQFGGSQYSVGGDFGMAVMLSGSVGLEIGLTVTQDWVSDVVTYQYGGYPYYFPSTTTSTKSGTSLMFGMGISGFLQ